MADSYRADRTDRFVAYSILVLLVWVALPLGSNRPWSAMLFVLFTALLSSLLAWSNLRRKEKMNVKGNRVLKAAMPLLILLILSQFWVGMQWLMGFSQNSSQTFYYLLLGCAYCLLYFLIVKVFTTRKRLTLLLATLIMSGALQGFYGSVMTLSGLEWHFFADKLHYRGHATGTFVNRNHLAGYLEMTIACGIGLLLALRTSQPFNLRNSIELLIGPKAKIRLSLVIMVIALVMSHSRMGNAAFFTSLIVVGGLFVLINKKHRLRNSLILISIIVIDMMVISQYFGLEQLKDRLMMTQITDQVVNGEVVQKANELRDNVLVSTLPLLGKHPLIGSGAGSFESVYQQYPKGDIRLHFDHAHNDYVQFLIEFGVIGLAPLALFVIISLWHALTALWLRESWYRSGVGFGASMGIVSILIHSVTDFNLQIPANAATFTTLCAIAVLAKYHVKTKATHTHAD